MVLFLSTTRCFGSDSCSLAIMVNEHWLRSSNLHLTSLGSWLVNHGYHFEEDPKSARFQLRFAIVTSYGNASICQEPYHYEARCNSKALLLSNNEAIPLAQGDGQDIFCSKSGEGMDLFFRRAADGTSGWDCHSLENSVLPASTAAGNFREFQIPVCY